MHKCEISADGFLFSMCAVRADEKQVCVPMPLITRSTPSNDLTGIDNLAAG